MGDNVTDTAIFHLPSGNARFWDVTVTCTITCQIHTTNFVITIIMWCMNLSSLFAGFSFGAVSLVPFSPSDGTEATAGQSVLDLAVPVIISINSSFLQSDTIVTISVSGGSATGRFILLVTYMHLHHVYIPLYFFHLQWAKTMLCLEMK